MMISKNLGPYGSHAIGKSSAVGNRVDNINPLLCVRHVPEKCKDAFLYLNMNCLIQNLL